MESEPSVAEKIVIFDFDGVLCLHLLEPKPFDDGRAILEFLKSRGWRIMIASFNEDAVNILKSWGWSHMIDDSRCGGYSKPSQIISLLASTTNGWCKDKSTVFFFDDEASNIADMSVLSEIVTSVKIDPACGVTWSDISRIEPDDIRMCRVRNTNSV